MHIPAPNPNLFASESIPTVNTSRIGFGFINTSPSYCVKESSNRQIIFFVPYVTASSNVITNQLTTIF
jgi:hypothetical protein